MLLAEFQTVSKHKDFSNVVLSMCVAMA